jgi:hypothetical protein
MPQPPRGHTQPHSSTQVRTRTRSCLQRCHRLWQLLHGEAGHVWPHDSRLFARDEVQGITQQLHVIKAQAGDACACVCVCACVRSGVLWCVVVCCPGRVAATTTAQPHLVARLLASEQGDAPHADGPTCDGGALDHVCGVDAAADADLQYDDLRLLRHKDLQACGRITTSAHGAVRAQGRHARAHSSATRAVAQLLVTLSAPAMHNRQRHTRAPDTHRAPRRVRKRK